MPPASMTLTLIWFDPVWVTWATAESLSGPRLMFALIWFGPSADSVMPCGMPPALASAVNVTSAEALNWSTVALLSPVDVHPVQRGGQAGDLEQPGARLLAGWSRCSR